MQASFLQHFLRIVPDMAYSKLRIASICCQICFSLSSQPRLAFLTTQWSCADHFQSALHKRPSQFKQLKINQPKKHTKISFTAQMGCATARAYLLCQHSKTNFLCDSISALKKKQLP